MACDWRLYANENFCYVTTKGRKTGRAHTIEIWFALDGPTLYMLAGGRDKTDWVRNLQRDSVVNVRMKEERFKGLGRVVVEGSEEDERARQLVFTKYQARSNEDLRDWSRRSLPVAIDLTNDQSQSEVPPRP
ncbi:nitroreductase/quinone reductase family protein [Ktedonospora formicarum]|uniref:Nitroreductase family deazaflavin-dependent oxidoreductase n=1 Tax=Ktedonospora formicarum TaxID=2778364 RepID=A0A8J3MVN0_9CHLR|nr:nitroreductase/quinone reductase family protein [Ktedonospora formicarum]GHO49510.1 hypothetical protein KSX_76730 [Ktedonospora formicarum]